MGGCQGQVEVLAGFLYTQITVTTRPSLTPDFLLACQAWASPGEQDWALASDVGSVWDSPKNGARLMVPMASSGESSSWQRSETASPSAGALWCAFRSLAPYTHGLLPSSTLFQSTPGVLRLAG